MSGILKTLKAFAVNSSFRSKLFVIFGTILISLFLTFSSYMYFIVKRQMTEQTIDSLEITVNQLKENSNNVLKRYADLSFNQYTDKYFAEYLQLKDTKMDNYIDAYMLYFNRVFGQKSSMDQNISSITVYTKNDFFPSDGLYILPYSLLNFEPEFIKRVEANPGKIIFGNIAKDKQGYDTFIAARDLRYEENRDQFGILAIEVKCIEFYSLIEKEIRNKDIYIVMDDYTIISCKNFDGIGKNINDVLPFQNEDIGGEKGSFDIVEDGKKRLVVYNTMNEGWKIISVMPYEQFLHSIDSQLNNMMFFFIIAFFMAMVSLYFVAKFMTKRIDILTGMAKQIERSHFPVTMPNMGTDEIGQFAEVFLSMSKQINILIKDIYEKEILKKKAELNTLQAQINPHFMYNSLSSISALALKSGDISVYGMVNKLSKFYRISLNKGKTMITIKEELELTENYIAVQNIRFGGIIHVTYDIDEALLDKPTLKLIIQPFVENAINHGLWDDDRGLSILIRIYTEEESADIIFQIADNGSGMTEDTLNNIFNPYNLSKSKGYGIRNVDERVKIYYGEGYGVKIICGEGAGVTVYIKIKAEV